MFHNIVSKAVDKTIDVLQFQPLCCLIHQLCNISKHNVADTISFGSIIFGNVVKHMELATGVFNCCAAIGVTSVPKHMFATVIDLTQCSKTDFINTYVLQPFPNNRC